MALRFVTGDADQARDAVDEACARAWQRLSRGRSIDVLAAWIRVVAFNVARDRLRRRRSERLACARLAQRRTDHNDVSADPAIVLDVQAALARLPRRQREIVAMFYFLDHTVDTIARELDIPTGTVKSALHRARETLAATLGDNAPSAGRIGHA